MTTAQFTKSGNVSQLEMALQALANLKRDITRLDRKEAMAKLNISYETVNRYLRGTGKDSDTAVSLVEFFKRRIDERSKSIAKAV